VGPEFAKTIAGEVTTLRTYDRGARKAVRLVDHAIYLARNGLDAATGMDDAGEMDAMGLGWSS
jgi:hypothetical protein